MRNAFAAPPTIRRIAARRVFQSRDGKPVVLTLGVPRRVPGSDWGCAVQITGLNTGWRRPKYVFGIDALQALHLALRCAAAVLDAARADLKWLGVQGDLGLPKFLPALPRAEQDRLEARVERDAARFWARVQRRPRSKNAANGTRSRKRGTER